MSPTHHFVDANLREALGADDRELINIDAIDPDFYSLDMFGADDLLNQGSNLVSYGGYDPYGNKTNNRPTIEDFFTETNEARNNTRPIGAYDPI